MDDNEHNERAAAELTAAKMKAEASDIVWTMFIRYAVVILMNDRLTKLDPSQRETVIDGFRHMVNAKVEQDMRQAREVLDAKSVEGMMLDFLGGGNLLKKAEAVAEEIHGAAENMINLYLRTTPKEDSHG